MANKRIIIIAMLHSLFNKIEISRVLYYVKKLLNSSVNGRRVKADDIGIISPYKKQVHFNDYFYLSEHSNNKFTCF